MTSAAATDAVEVAVLDLDGCIVAVNPAWQDFCTRNQGEPQSCGPGTSYLEVCDASADLTSLKVGVAIREILVGERLTTAAFTIPCDGSEGERWFDLSVSPRFGDDAGVSGATVVLWRVERPPRRLTFAPRLAMIPDQVAVWDLIEAFPDGTVLVDGAGIITHANRELEHLSGYHRSRLIGQPIEMLVPGRLRSRHQVWAAGYRTAPRLRAMGAGTELALRRIDGSELPVEISLAPVTLGEVKMSMASIRDVSDQRADDRSRQHLLAILDLTPDSVLVVDVASHRIEYANHGATLLLGYSREELGALLIDDLCAHTVEFPRDASTGPHQSEVVRLDAQHHRIDCDSRRQVVTTEQGVAKMIVVDRDASGRKAREGVRRRLAGRSALVSRISGMVLADVPLEEVDREILAGARILLEAGDTTLEEPAPTVVHPSVARTAEEDRTAAVLDRAVVAGTLAPEDQEMIRDLGREIAVVLDLGGARHDRERLEMLEDRQRIGRDLHDTVIQALIGIGLQLAMPSPTGSAEASLARDDLLIEELDNAIMRLRLVVFDTRTAGPDIPLTETLEGIVAGASRTLGHVPALVVRGDLARLTREVVNHLVPVLREALSNVARHAQASRTTITVDVGGDRVGLSVEDDGRGLGDGKPGGGTTNFSERAAMLDGASHLGAGPAGGTLLQWTAALGPVHPRAEPRPASGERGHLA